MEEIWGPTPAQRRYEPPGKLATDLGNTQTGDGKRFKGRGPIQITGRANYRRYGDLLGVDLIADPPRAALPEVAFRVAGLYWSKKGLNQLADKVTRVAFKEITRRINGGFNGLADREKYYEKAKTVLGVTGPIASPEGAPGLEQVADPTFERGYEAVRADAVRRRRSRKRKSVKTKRVKTKAAKRRVSRKTRRVSGRGRSAKAKGSRARTS
jgi:hypothetical protein